ncbi:MAG: tetratricopeptide repeat protein [Blastocatellia bacterium]|nr:tetratricopeptide repeat protein [Blastocatellia bacterium]
MSKREKKKIESPFFNIYKKELLLAAFLVLVNVAVFGQVAGFPFINFDDNGYIFANSSIKDGLSAKSISYAFTSGEMGHWHPVTWLSLLLDYQLFGLNPAAFHLVNLLFHIFNTLLVFAVFRYTTEKFWHSGLVALIFAIHPTHVEPVVWISSRKDMLATFWGLLSLLAYVKYVKESSRKWYFLALLFLSLGLMSKSLLVTFPFVMLLLDFWPLDRFRDSIDQNFSKFLNTGFSLLKEKLLFFLPVGFTLFMAFRTKAVGGAIASASQQAIRDRSGLSDQLVDIMESFSGYTEYLIKFFWPTKLAIFYPYLFPSTVFVTIGVALSLTPLIFLFSKKARNYPYLFVGSAWYLGILVPVSSFLIADRYTYVPYIGLSLMLVWGLGELIQEKGVMIVTFVTALLLSIVTFSQVSIWSSDKILFEHALAVTDENPKMHFVLGQLFEKNGQLDAALKEYSNAVELCPTEVEPRFNMAIVRAMQGNLDEAISIFQECIRIKPDSAEARYNLAKAVAQKGDTLEAAKQYKKAIELDPGYSEAHYNYATLLLGQNQLDRAAEHFAQAIKLQPDNADFHYNYGITLFKLRRFADAKLQFETVLQLRPDYSNAAKAIEAVKKNL